MRSDPSRPVRALFSKELLQLLREARGAAISRIRENLIDYRFDAEEIAAILDMINRHYLIDKGQTSIYRWTNTAYERSIGDTIQELMRAQKPRGYQLNIAASFTLKDQQAIRNIAAMSFEDLKGISASTSAKIVRHLKDLDKQGAGITKISRAIYDDWNGEALYRAERITRTSITEAYNHAAWDRILQYAPYKEWIPTLTDKRTRDSHLKMSGVIIPTEEPFVVPAFRPSPGSRKMVPEAMMMFPGDPSMGADLGQRINCRCAMAPRFIRK